LSHEATNWAIKQRGLKPSAKLLLWQLCDRFHPDNGCFPSQDTLAHDCEMSRSSVNRHLEELEAKGRIKRVRRYTEGSHRQRATRYLLGFQFSEDPAPKSGDGSAKKDQKPRRKSGRPTPESGDEFDKEPCPNLRHGTVSQKAPKLCPKNRESRVSNWGSNLVKEPVKNLARAREAKFFTDDERFKARQIADHINGGGSINPEAIAPRVRCCLLAEEMISNDIAERHGIAEKKAGGRNG
jgi:helix-turn-helix protein